MKSNLKSVALAALTATVIAVTLSACAELIIGGAALGVGALVTLDRRSSGAQLDDEGIELRAGSRLREAVGDRGHVNVTSYNRQVLLTGEVANEQVKQAAEQAVARIDNVKGVVNELAIMANTSLMQRSNDALITGKVKASLVDASDLYVGAFKVVTERGTVYLMGRVTQREADRATQMTRNISGVQRVVRIFEVLSEEEVRRLAPLGRSAAPAAAPASAQPASPQPATPSTVAPPPPAPGATTAPAVAPSASPTPLPPLPAASARR